MSDFTKVLLNIEDPNLIVDQVTRKPQAMQVLAHLTYTPRACTECGAINQHSITKYGWRTVHIRLPRVSEWAVILELRKQYFECHDCRSHFLAQSSVVDPNCSISKNTKQACLTKLNDTVSMKHIAQELNTSSNFVSRVITEFTPAFKTDLLHLPRVLQLDEIKSTKDAHGSMSCVLMDGQKHQLTDILDTRTLPSLTRYFNRFTQEARESVRFLVTDMNYTYPQLTDEVFPNAIVITDRFHIVNTINLGLNQTRIQSMKQFGTSTHDYKVLKKYWKLLLKPIENLDYKNFRKFTHFKYLITETDVVDYLLSLDPELARTYGQAQRLCGAVRTRDIEEMHLALADTEDCSELLAKHLTYIKEHLDYVDNALTYRYSNGPLEGTNNRIKVLKRNGYGYARFRNFRLRILIMLNVKIKHPIIIR